MAYIGKSPSGTGVRIRYYFTQTSGGATSISGPDDTNKTLSFSDGEYVDVYLNGVSLVAGTDYNTTTANTIGGLSALANGDVVEVVVYDIFTVADTVSQSSGGTFSGAVIMSNGLTVDDDGAAPLTVDRATSDGDAIIIQKDGSQAGGIATHGGDTLEIYGEGSTKSGLRFGGSALLPLRNAGALASNVVDIGSPAYLFKDIYLSGGVRVGGTGSANLLEDYEEGTWTPTADAGITFTGTPSGTYIKVGNLVTVFDSLTCSLTNNQAFTIGGLPFDPAAGNEPVVLILNNGSTFDYVPRGRTGTGSIIKGRSPATVSGINLMIQATYRV
tara:strand:- start:775 stop:1761 length:987 start_codon:yes stop_codon:yes gene_type:complete